MQAFAPTPGGNPSMAPSILERMYQRSPSAPPSRRVHGGYNIVYMSLRHVVFDLVPESADFVSDVLYDLHDERELIDFMVDYRVGKTEKLRDGMLKARHTWAAVLRDNEMVDVRLIVLPAKQIDVFRDENRYPYGTQEARFTELKEKLVREAMGMPYYNSGRRDPETGAMSFDIVMHKSALHKILTEKFRTAKGVNIQILTNAAPNPSTDLKEDPECIFRYSKVDDNGDVVYNKVVTPPKVVRKRSSTIERLRTNTSKKLWNKPYACPSNLTGRPWDKTNAPFSKEVFDPDSNDNWWQEDHKIRAAQIAEWKQEMEERMRTGEEPEPDVFDFLEPLCDVYTSHRIWSYQKKIAHDEIIDFKRAEMMYFGAVNTHQRAVDNLAHVRHYYPRNLLTNYQAKEDVKTMKRALEREEKCFKAMLVSKHAQNPQPRPQELSTPVEREPSSSMRKAEAEARKYGYGYATKTKQGPPTQPPRKAPATVAGPDDNPLKMGPSVYAPGVSRNPHIAQRMATAETLRQDSGVTIDPQDDPAIMPDRSNIVKDSAAAFTFDLTDTGVKAHPVGAVRLSAKARSKMGGVPMARLPANRNRSIRPPRFEDRDPTESLPSAQNSIVVSSMRNKCSEGNLAPKQGRTAMCETVPQQCQQATPFIAAIDTWAACRMSRETNKHNREKEVIEGPPSENSRASRPFLVQSSADLVGEKRDKRVSFRMDSRLSASTRRQLAAVMCADEQNEDAFIHPARRQVMGVNGITSTESSPPDSLMWTPDDTPTDFGSPSDSPDGSSVSTPNTTPNMSRRDSVDDPSEHAVSSPVDIRAPQTGKRVGQFRVDAATSLKAVMYLDGVKTASKMPSRMQRLLLRISSSAPLKKNVM